MRWSDATVSPTFEDVRRTAVLEALARGEFAPGPPDDEDSAGSGLASSGTGTGSKLPHGLCVLSEFATGCFGGALDSSPADRASGLIHRIIAATRPEEIIAALRLLGIRGIAERLRYLHDVSLDGDPDEPPMALDSLRELALFFATERPWNDPEIGISPDGLLQAEWRVGGGILAMKFLPGGFIQFAAVSRLAGHHPPLRVHGTLPKDQAMGALQAFAGQGTP